MKSILPVKKFLGLVEMTSGLVNASFSLPEWQAVKMIFFAPCPVISRLNTIFQMHTVKNLKDSKRCLRNIRVIHVLLSKPYSTFKISL